MPALNEALAIESVIEALRQTGAVSVIVVDNGSSDATALIAARLGVRVVMEPRRGYGAACLAGIAALEAAPADVLVFMDADGSDDPCDLQALIDPIQRGSADLVVGSRELGCREPGALASHARLGNRLAVWLIEWRTGQRFTDLGPFRAVRFAQLQRLGMTDRDYGWTVEMQMRAARLGLRCLEVPVRYRRRIGRSKISGTWRGSLGAALKILWTIVKYGR